MVRLALLLLLLPALAFGVTTRTSIIDPDNAAWCDYTSLTAWDSDLARNIVTADTVEVAECICTGGTSDGDMMLTTSWVTDATRYIKIWTNPDSTYRHNGTWQTGNKYRIVTVGSGHGIAGSTATCNTDYTQILGMQIDVTHASYSAVAPQQGGNHFWKIEDGVFRGTGDRSSAHRGIYRYWPTAYGVDTLFVSNCIIYGFVSGIQQYYSDGVTTYFNNNTVYNNTYGIKGGGSDVIAKNNIIQDSMTSDYQGTNYNANSTHNLSEDATAPAYGTYYRSRVVAFVDSAGRDFHLANADTSARERGTDLSADTYPISDDIDGDARTVSWSLGADERDAAAPAGDVFSVWTRLRGGVWFGDGNKQRQIP